MTWADRVGWVIVAACVAFIAAAAYLGLSRALPQDPRVIVVPTCAELDEAGYDGRISCINEQGDVVRPGES